MYEGPIKIIQSQLEMKMEDDILKAVRSQHIEVDKEELIKALTYDRNQYDEGRSDGIGKVVAMLEDMKGKPAELVYDVALIDSIIDKIGDL